MSSISFKTLLVSAVAVKDRVIVCEFMLSALLFRVNCNECDKKKIFLEIILILLGMFFEEVITKNFLM
jgi:hypothetical protein